ncbi:hypothetical protein [uncultured Shewanella sp.]|uniref:hypothetical protein n=1 Tax=uncultured Shewanella sp. TaxID=173975 RepID=UPI002611E4C3|nr:hypothetical protein [uncultured Shewanella sp.]
MKTSKLYLSCIIASLLITGCGGSSSDDAPEVSKPDPVVIPTPEPEPTVTMSGKVIDGYVSGATVWLDLNGDGVYNEDEPSTVSQAAGEYHLELSAENQACAQYSNLYVDVPVGAFDEDNGEVKAAYQMMLPAGFSPVEGDEVFHVTPITTVLFQMLNTELQNRGAEFGSCEALKDNDALRAIVETELDEALLSIVDRYNLSIENIFSDFIATGDNDRKQLALNIVKGLKASLAYQTTAKERFPKADFIRVEFYQGSAIDNNNAYPEAWYRDIAIWNPDGFQSELVKVSDDLQTKVRDIYLREVTNIRWGEYGELAQKKDRYSYGGDGSTYTCANSEAVIIRHMNDEHLEVEFALSNESYSDEVATVKECDNQVYSGGDNRYFETSYVDMGIFYESRFDTSKVNVEFTALADWVELEGKSEQLDVDLFIEYFEGLAYQFDKVVDEERHSSWWKRSTDDMHGNRIIITKDQNGWEKMSYQDDGTYILTCSQDGETWGECS